MTDVLDRVQRRGPVWRVGHEVLVMGAFWMLYTLGRALAGRGVMEDGLAHATDVWSFERTIHLPSEAALQEWALGWADGVRAANLYYAWEHWLTFGALFLYLLLVRPAYYVWFRRVIVLTTTLALVGHFLYPLAPPRLTPSLHVSDTGVRFGQAVYGADSANHGLANQYAAMPSMHIGWAVLFAITVILAARTPWRWLMVLDPILTTYVVVVTGNHFWLDGIVGVAMLGVSLLVVRTVRAARATRR